MISSACSRSINNDHGKHQYMSWSVARPGLLTQRFVDMTVKTDSGPLRQLSLKSTAAQNISESTVRISKLTKAAWIQDARTPRDRRRETRALFQS